jgi:hypothetical protein
MQKLFKKSDLIIIGGLIVLSLIGAAFYFFVSGKKAAKAEILVDAKLVQTVDLSKNQTFTVTGVNGGTNLVVVSDGKIAVTDADCPDKICVNTGAISKPGQTIVCMPHRVVVQIKGNSTDEDGFDGEAR